MKIFFATILIILLSSCSAYIGTREVKDSKSKPKGEYGYIALNISGQHIPKGIAKSENTGIFVYLSQKSNKPIAKNIIAAQSLNQN